MEFDELLITTGVDALVRLVKERQKIELEEASGLLNIPNETLEEWVNVLEEENIIRIEYKLGKTNLVWIKPTEEEVEEKAAEITKEKKVVETQITGFRGRVVTENDDLSELKHSFDEFYQKAYAKIAEIEKKTQLKADAGTGVGPKTGLTEIEIAQQFENEITKVEGEIGNLRDSLTQIRYELSSVPLQTKEAGASAAILENIEKTKGEITELQKTVELNKKRALKQDLGKESGISIPSIKEIERKFQMVQKEFAAIKTKNAQMRQDMISLHESSEILHGVAESIMGEEDKISTLRNQVAEIAKEADQLSKKVVQITDQVMKSLEMVERIGSSMDTAKGVLVRFPSQDKVMTELKNLEDQERGLQEKCDALEEIVAVAGGRQVSARQFEESLNQLKERLDDLQQEMEALDSTLQEEKNTYLTFQKIREKVVPSLEVYQKLVDEMETRLARLQSNSQKQLEEYAENRHKLAESIKKSDIADVSKVLDEVEEKKRMLDEIKTKLDELVDISDNLTKKSNLLSKQARLLEVRSSVSATEGTAAYGGSAPDKEKKTQQTELSEEEEEEFKRKREELKRLIQKLWCE